MCAACDRDRERLLPVDEDTCRRVKSPRRQWWEKPAGWFYTETLPALRKVRRDLDRDPLSHLNLLGITSKDWTKPEPHTLKRNIGWDVARAAEQEAA